MSLFDPGTVNRQIDAYLATVPPGKRVLLLGNANLTTKTASAAVMLKVSDSIGAYVRVSKTPGQPVESDAGVKIAFLAGLPDEDPFTYAELVALFKDRGFGWIRAHISAYRVLHGGSVEL